MGIIVSKGNHLCTDGPTLQSPSPYDEELRHSVDREVIPRGKPSTGYFGPVMVSLLGASAAGPTCYGRANSQ